MITALILTLALQQVGLVDPAEQLAAMRRELAALVTDTGRARGGDTDPLDDLASRSGRLADDARDAQVRAAARLLQARAYHAIAQQAMTDGRASLASLRLVQMRSAANEARRLAPPDAKPIGDYWLLLADLVDAQRNARTLAERQIGVLAQMERFLSVAAQNDAAPDAPIVLHVKRALMRLCDQVGENARAATLLDELRAAGFPVDPLDAAHVAAHAQRVGEPLDPSLRPSDADGDPAWTLLIVERADDDSSRADDSSRTAGVDPGLVVRRIAVTSDDDAAALPHGLGEALPHVALIDETGVIRAIGHTLAVAARYAELSRSTAPIRAPERAIR